MNSNQNTYLSIVIPVFNELGNLSPLVLSLIETLSNQSHEILIIDDGSTDGTREEGRKLERENAHVRLIPLKGNFGQTAAMAAGIDAAKGKIIIPMDGDGQNDPKNIPELLAKMEEGFDVVSGWRKNRNDSLFIRKIPSWIANGLISLVTGVHLHDYGCTIKAYRASLIKDISISGEMHRFLPAWCAWRGGKITEIPVIHHPRKLGQSKYGLFRIFKVIIDLITVKFFSGYLSKPNHLFSGGAFVLFSMGLLFSVLTVADKFGPDLFPKYRIPLLLLSLFLGLTAIFMVFLGLLAELMVRLYFTIQKQKPYVIQDDENS